MYFTVCTPYLPLVFVFSYLTIVVEFLQLCRNEMLQRSCILFLGSNCRRQLYFTTPQTAFNFTILTRAHTYMYMYNTLSYTITCSPVVTSNDITQKATRVIINLNKRCAMIADPSCAVPVPVLHPTVSP